MSYLSGEVAVVFGGSSGIGRATATLFAQHGARIVLISRDPQRLQEAETELRSLGGDVTSCSVDVSDVQAIKRAAQLTADAYGQVDVFIYGAGAFYLSPVETMDLALARRLMNTNYWGAVHATQSFLPLVRKANRKSMVYMSSLSVPCTPAFFAPYAATKYALDGLVRSLRQEVSCEGIHVGTIYPGPVDTPLIQDYLHGHMYRLPRGIPVVTPDIVASGVLLAILRRKQEFFIPRHLKWAARLSVIHPSLLAAYYRLSVPGWREDVDSLVQNRRAAVQDGSAEFEEKGLESPFEEQQGAPPHDMAMTSEPVE